MAMGLTTHYAAGAGLIIKDQMELSSNSILFTAHLTTHLENCQYMHSTNNAFWIKVTLALPEWHSCKI